MALVIASAELGDLGDNIRAFQNQHIKCALIDTFMYVLDAVHLCYGSSDAFAQFDDVFIVNGEILNRQLRS